MDFYVNIKRNTSEDRILQWDELEADAWCNLHACYEHLLPMKTAFNVFKSELKNLKIHKSKHFVQGWRLWEFWDKFDGDDHYNLACLAQIKKEFVFFIFEGFDTH